MTKLFQGRVAIVTGAGKGLGRAYAMLLARLGARVVVNNRRHAGEAESSADGAVRAIVEAGGAATAEYSDVAAAGAGDALRDAALEAFGRLDIFIANAGVSEGRSFHKQSPEEFRRTFEVNLLGTALALQPSFRHLYEQRGGRVLLSTSVAGLYGEHGLPAYSASKAALVGLMYALGQEGAPRGVRVNAIAPYAATQMTAAHMPDELARRLRPEEVAPVAAWLVSDDCELSGEILIAGGGRVARARMMETEPIELQRDVGPADRVMGPTDWAVLGARPLDRHYPGASAQFRAFTAEL